LLRQAKNTLGTAALLLPNWHFRNRLDFSVAGSNAASCCFRVMALDSMVLLAIPADMLPSQPVLQDIGLLCGSHVSAFKKIPYTLFCRLEQLYVFDQLS
jgi:hypothetical protein